MSGYNYESFGQCELNAPDFWAVARVGGQAPDFNLTSIDGKSVSLAALRGRGPLLLEFGSIT